MENGDRGRDGGCSCRICRRDLQGLDAGDEKLISDVQGYGWHLVSVDAPVDVPDWVFTVGLWHTLGQPELVMVGLRTGDMGTWLNRIGEQFRAGMNPFPEERRGGVIDGHDILWKPVHPSWFPQLLGYGLWFYGELFRALQVVWPDRADRWPWDASATETCRAQPVLWEPFELADDRWHRNGEHWHFPTTPKTRVFVTRRIGERVLPVLAVVHELDGGWVFLDGQPADGSDDFSPMHMGHLVQWDPTLLSLADLPAGWQATRRSLSAPFVRAPLSE